MDGRPRREAGQDPAYRPARSLPRPGPCGQPQRAARWLGRPGQPSCALSSPSAARPPHRADRRVASPFRAGHERGPGRLVRGRGAAVVRRVLRHPTVVRPTRSSPCRGRCASRPCSMSSRRWAWIGPR